MIKGNDLIYNSLFYTTSGKSMGLKLNDLNKSETPGPGAQMNFSVILKVFINLGKIKRKLIKNLMWMKKKLMKVKEVIKVIIMKKYIRKKYKQNKNNSNLKDIYFN